MGSPKQTDVDFATAVFETDPGKRSTLIRQAVRTANAKLDERTARGICWDCDDPIVGSREQLFYGDTHCEKHARAEELERLREDQEADRG